MSKSRVAQFLLIGIVFMTILGCLRPKSETIHLVSHPGNPIRILGIDKKPAKVTGQSLKNPETLFEQDVTGWIAMPEDHWEVIKQDLIAYRKRLEEDAAKGSTPTK
jgi:hypothetical protein